MLRKYCAVYESSVVLAIGAIFLLCPLRPAGGVGSGTPQPAAVVQRQLEIGWITAPGIGIRVRLERIRTALNSPSESEEHIRLEKKTLVLAKEAQEAIKGSKAMLVQTYLLEYLLEDEQKHNRMLERLASIQKGMYPYA